MALRAVSDYVYCIPYIHVYVKIFMKTRGCLELISYDGNPRKDEVRQIHVLSF